jgi:hypothetical protein
MSLELLKKLGALKETQLIDNFDEIYRYSETICTCCGTLPIRNNTRPQTIGWRTFGLNTMPPDQTKENCFLIPDLQGGMFLEWDDK